MKIVANFKLEKRRRYFSVIAILLLGLISCNAPNCPCEIDPDIQIRNDSFITVIYDLAKERGNYFEKYDEPMLQELAGKSYRLIQYSWMKNKASVYRINQSGGEYYLNYREIMKSENEYDEFGQRKDSINISKKIPLTDEFMTNLDSLFEANCFWGIPIIPSFSLDPVDFTLEISNPQLEKCSKRAYHVVDLLGLDDETYESLTSICNEFIEVVESNN